MRVLVCGSRDADPSLEASVIEFLCDLDHEAFAGISAVIHGGTRGPDLWGASWANRNGLDIGEFRPDWDAHGKAAGPMRNQRMLDEGKPHFVVAVWNGKSRGTRDMIERSVKAGVPVRIIPCR